MRKLRSILLIVLSALFAVCVGFTLAACGNSNYRKPKGGVTDDGSGDPNNPNGNAGYYFPDGVNPDDYYDANNGYQISTVSLGGMPIGNVRVSVWNGDIEIITGYTAQDDPTTSAIEEDAGTLRLPITPGNYELTYELPVGYKEIPETLHTLTPDNLKVSVSFTSAVIKDGLPAGKIFVPGDIMYDFQLTDYTGTTVVLSELLESRQLVILNLWEISCVPCRNEFPALNTTYNQHLSEMAVLAISNVDTNAQINNYKLNFGSPLDFFMSADSAGVVSHFSFAGYPTSVFIDRYGVIVYQDTGSVESPEQWSALVSRYLGDNYVQRPQMGSADGNTGYEYLPPPSDVKMSSNQAMNQALLAPETYDSLANGSGLLKFDVETGSDADVSWPFIATQDADGPYIAPSNLGEDSTYATVYVTIELEVNEILEVDVKLNTEINYDILYLILSRSRENYFAFSGKTENGDWETVRLYTATRHTSIELGIQFTKNEVNTVDDEFVGLKNLRIYPIDENTSTPLHIPTEMARETSSGMEYENYSYNENDGFYHYGNENGPLIFADILGETLWSDRHLKNYTVYDDSGSVALSKSVYNILYWVLNDYTDESNTILGNFTNNAQLNRQYTDTIIDSFYIQDGQTIRTPVTKDVKDMLDAFAAAVHNGRTAGNIYNSTIRDEASYTQSTWLEFCTYYRIPVTQDHSSEGDNCQSYVNPALGLTLTYAIDIEMPSLDGDDPEVWYYVDTVSKTTRLNRAAGLFYKFTATEAGVYRFVSKFNEDSSLSDCDPKILIWAENVDVYYGRPLYEIDDPVSAEGYFSFDKNFEVYIYLNKGDTIYPQLTTSSYDLPEIYSFTVEYAGAQKHVLQIATTGNGMLSTDIDADGNFVSGSEYYLAIRTQIDSSDGYYHHILDNNSFGSVVYIDFLNRNYYDGNGHTLKDMIDVGFFDFSKSGGYNFTADLNDYYVQATSGDKEDPLYGLVPADAYLVWIICQGINSEWPGDDAMQMGWWKAFAYYYQYYGDQLWVEIDN